MKVLKKSDNDIFRVRALVTSPEAQVRFPQQRLQPIRPYSEPLATLGYLHVPHVDDAVCPFFHRPSKWPHSHHVHVVQLGGAEERRTLAFRDYLREHGDTAREYEQLKRDLATQLGPSDREYGEAYARGKTDFIERIVGNHG